MFKPAKSFYDCMAELASPITIHITHGTNHSREVLFTGSNKKSVTAHYDKSNIVRTWILKTENFTYRASILALFVTFGITALARAQQQGKPLNAFQPDYGAYFVAVGSHSCVEHWDTGDKFWFEGTPPLAIRAWLQRSRNGEDRNVPKPIEWQPLKECLPGLHHS